MSLKIKNDLVLRKIADQYVIVPVGKRVHEIPMIVYISSSGAYLWDYMTQNEFQAEDLVKKLLEHYSGVSEETLKKDVDAYIKLLIDNFIIDDGKSRGFVYVQVPSEDK